MRQQKKSQWNLTILCEKEEVVDVIEELLKEDEEDEGDYGKTSSCCMCYGTR